MRISDWSSDVCSSDLRERLHLEFHRVTLRSSVASRRFTLRRRRSNPVAWPTRDIGSQTGKSSDTSGRNMLNIAWPAVLVLPARPDAAAKVLQVAGPAAVADNERTHVAALHEAPTSGVR